MNIQERCRAILQILRQKHLVVLDPYQREPVFLVSDRYPGVWLEHVYDGIVWAQLTGDWSIACNVVRLFLRYQKADGQLPCYFRKDKGIGYSHLQECVSFASLCYEIYEETGDRVFLEEAYQGCVRWAEWLSRNRMGSSGLLEVYCGFDTGHDNSSRLDGMKYPRSICYDASVRPEDCPVAPMIGADLNAVFYGTHSALGRMADALGLPETDEWMRKAEEHRKKLFAHCYAEEDLYFYDVDRRGAQRKCRSVAITALFCERVLDRDLADRIFTRYFRNEREFNTPYPYPSVSVSDPGFSKRMEKNDWGYFSQSLTMLRSLRWMKHYGYTRELKHNMEVFLSAWTGYDGPVGQELDPLTGCPPAGQAAYSSGMLFYLAAAKELGYFTDFE